MYDSSLFFRTVRECLLENSSRSFFKNRLLKVLGDDGSNRGDILLAIVDFMCEQSVVQGDKFVLKSPESVDFPRWVSNFLEFSLARGGYIFPHKIQDSMAYSITKGSECRRVVSGGPLDKVLELAIPDCSYERYNSVGQRDAIRSVLLSDKNSVLLINLPTGAGKTFVVEAVTSFENRKKGTTVCIVPTVGLKYELAKRYCNEFQTSLTPSEITYPPVDNASDEFKKQIRQKIETGSIPIVFCAPESLDAGFLKSLVQSSAGGYLKSFAVDEAHLIAQWGGDFRYHFEALPLIIHMLKGVSREGFRVMLLSATWSANTVSDVTELFDRYGQIETVESSYLRSEISYRIKRVEGIELEKTLISEIVTNPKPLIIYVNRKKTADRVMSLLDGLDISRKALFTGSTDNKDRGRIIESWQGNAVDVIVATSAFGVGMDKGDVRSIIHYGIPESLDRFYQQSGRAGRDGLPATSIIIYSDETFKEALSAAIPTIIGADGLINRAQVRFENMRRYALARRDGKLLFDLTSLNPDSDFDNDREKEWNWKTLLLLHKYKILKLTLPDFFNSAHHTDGQSDFDGLDKVYVEILDLDIFSPDFWGEKFQRIRERELAKGSSEFKTISDAITSNNPGLCVSLSKYFSFDGFDAERVCRGCNGHQESINYQVGGVSRSSVLKGDPTRVYRVNTISYESGRLSRTEIKHLAKIFHELDRRDDLGFVICSDSVRNAVVSELSHSSRVFVCFEEPGLNEVPLNSWLILDEDVRLDDMDPLLSLHAFRFVVGPYDYAVDADGRFWHTRLDEPLSVSGFYDRVVNGSYQ